jgi:hypothetical protein
MFRPVGKGDKEMTGEQDQCLECLEQARLLGMGAERELKLMADRAELIAALRRLVVFLGHVAEDGYDPFRADPLIAQARALLDRLEKQT